MKRSPLAVVFLTIVIDLLGFGLVLPLLPLYAKNLGASDAMVGLIFASYSALQFVVAPLWGRVSDRVGRRPIVLIGLFGSVLSYLLFAAAEIVPAAYAVPVLLLSRVAAGVFAGTITAAVATIADVTPDAERGRGMALIGAAFGVGFLIGPALGGLGHAYLGPLAPGLIAAGLSASAWVFAFLRFEEPSEKKPREGREPRLQALRHALAVPGVRPILALTFLGTLAFGILESTLALLARDRFPGWTPEANGWLFSYFGLWLALAQGVVVRRLMKRIAESRLVRWGAIALGAGLVAVAYVHAPLVLGALAPIAVLGSGLMMPSLTSLLSKRTNRKTQGEVLGANESIRSLGRIASHGAGPGLLAVGTTLPFWIGAATAGVALVVALKLGGGGEVGAGGPVSGEA